MSERNKDPIEQLIRATGPRRQVPEATTDRVKAAVRRHWRDTVRERRPTRRLHPGFILAAAAVILLSVGLITWDRLGSSGDQPSSAVILAVSGSTPMNVGDRLEFGTDLVTPMDGGIAIGTAPGQSVRLDAGSTVRLLARDILNLERGAVYVDSSGAGENDPPPLTIQTALGTFREIGTQFEVRLGDEKVRVRVREGQVAVDHGGDGLRLVAGDEMEIHFRGEVRTGTIDPASPEWGWIGELTPMMEIEGRPVLDFLAWIARERGLELQFQEVDLLAEAAGTVLAGSIDGMTLDQALDAVLPTCGMSHRIEGGTLTVLRSGD